MMKIAKIALDLPLPFLFDYLVPEDFPLGHTAKGRRVRVPFGKGGEKIGILVSLHQESDQSPEKLKPILEVYEDMPALPNDWFALCEFCARYYQAAQGEVMLLSLPAFLRKPKQTPLKPFKPVLFKGGPEQKPSLTEAQAQVLNELFAKETGFSAHLLFGVTGSGKTEVYLRLMEKVLSKGQQVLLLVPEINLTPQLEARIGRRFSQTPFATLHSDLSERQRARHFLAAFKGEARLILGTRLAVFTPLPNLGLIIIDEEHDASFKQQDGIRYSARDLAVFRAKTLSIPIVLGSATPSLESYFNAHPEKGRPRYTERSLPKRAVPEAMLPKTVLIDTRQEKTKAGFSQPLLTALQNRLDKGQMSLIFLNRRGFAPVLACAHCGWVKACHRCSANLVVHLADKRLRCHHCGLEELIPRACPDCGNLDIQGFGIGTQRLEATLAEHFPTARILRVDKDAAKNAKAWQRLLEKIHGGEADMLVGTQMLAKGHDFPRLTLVGILGADAGLFSTHFRAQERLFSQLMQVAGRAGRAHLAGEVLIQTQYPHHPLYAALIAQDYPRFAKAQLEERKTAGFPPFRALAMLRAEASHMEDSLRFLKHARAFQKEGEHPFVALYDPVPMSLARRANKERAQLLAESPSRAHLQAFLAAWSPFLASLKKPRDLSFHLDVDPLE